jgi:hypothetical protein
LIHQFPVESLAKTAGARPGGCEQSPRRRDGKRGECEMMRTVFLAAAAMVAIAGPAYAGHCEQPYAPVLKINGSTTADGLKTLRDDVASFVKASDLYQECLLAQDPNSPQIEANQAEKERVGQAFNTLLHAFKAAHPG